MFGLTLVRSTRHLLFYV